jgi:hypothetical protein
LPGSRSCYGYGEEKKSSLIRIRKPVAARILRSYDNFLSRR